MPETTPPQAAPLQGEGPELLKDLLVVSTEMSLMRCLGLGAAPLLGPALGLATLDVISQAVSPPSPSTPNISPAMAMAPPSLNMGRPK